MTAIIKHQFQKYEIAQRSKDSYVNLTHMCSTAGKQVNDYLRLDSTKEYMNALSGVTGIPVVVDSATVPALVNRTSKGTWAHPEVAIDCAQWVSVDLRIWANRTLVQILTAQKLPAPVEPKALPAVPEMSKRNQARKLVDQQAMTSGMQHSRLWVQAYHELEYCFGYPTCQGSAYAIAKSRAKNKLEKIEKDGQIDNLLAVMHKLWG